jgi:hypothetical protein
MPTFASALRAVVMPALTVPHLRWPTGRFQVGNGLGNGPAFGPLRLPWDLTSMTAVSQGGGGNEEKPRASWACTVLPSPPAARATPLANPFGDRGLTARGPVHLGVDRAKGHRLDTSLVP